MDIAWDQTKTSTPEKKDEARPLTIRGLAEILKQHGDLRGAVLRGADLSGANLQDANLRGAVGLTAKQICSTANGAQAQLDENLQREVDSVCGNSR